MFCKRIPNAKNGKPSILFQDLEKRFVNNRNNNLKVWGTATSSEFLRTYGDKLIFDSNDEPTLDSLMKYLDLRVMDNLSSRLIQYQEELNRDMPANHYDIAKRVVVFNDSHTDAIATISKFDNGSSTIVVNKMKSGDKKVKENIKNQFKVVTEIDKFMASLGYPIRWLDTGMYNLEDIGLMSPDRLKAVPNGFYDVIRVNTKESGYNAVSEEFAHLIIEMCRVNNANIISRLEEFVNNHPEVKQKVLGEDFDKVIDYYNSRGRIDLVNREVLGRILQGYINKAGIPTEINSTPIWERFIELIKNLFNRIRGNYTDTNIKYLENALSALYNDMVQPNKISRELLDMTAEIGDKMAHAKEANSLLEKTIEKVGRTTEKYLGASKRYKIEETINLKKPFEAGIFMINKARYAGSSRIEIVNGINIYLGAVVTSLETAYKKLSEIQMKESTLDFFTIQKYSNLLMEISDFLDSFPDIIHDVRVLCADLDSTTDPDMKLTDDEKTALGNAISSIAALEGQIAPYYSQLRRRVTHDFLLPHFANGSESITVPFGVHKGLEIKLFDLMDQVMFGETNLFNRWLVNMANADELFNACVAHAMDSYDEDIRQRVNNFMIRVKALHEEYRDKTGSNDTSFIFVIDPETNLPIGYYKSEYDYLRYEKERKEYWNSIKDKNIDSDTKSLMMYQWRQAHTVKKVRTYNFTFVDQNGKSHTVTKQRTDRVPIYKSTDLKKLNEAQLNYYNEFMKLKNEMDFLLPNNKVSLEKCIQKMVCDSAEGILNSHGIKNKLKAAFKIFKTNNFEYSENDEHDIYGRTQREKGFFKNLRKKWMEHEVLTIKKMATKFNGEEYHHVPLLYVNELDDMGKMSLDASASLLSYGMASINFSQMHRLIDVMELISQVSSARKLSKSSYMTKVIDPETSQLDPAESTVTNKNSNTDQMLRSFIERRVYKLYKFDGFASKGIDFLMKYTNVATLGYNAFTGIANINIGKYQTLVEAAGGEYFTFKDVLNAEVKYAKMLAQSGKDFGLTRNTNKLDLITMLFNIGLNHENLMHSSQMYKNKLVKIGGAVLNPGIFMEMGEHWIQHTGALAILEHYKLALVDKNNKIIKKDSLLDLLTVDPIVKDGKVVGGRLTLPENARKIKEENGVEVAGDKFNLAYNSKDLKDLSLIIAQVNQNMHGIYNRADAAEIKRTALGRALFQFRNHIIPTIRKRWKSVTHGMPNYNFRTQEWEEGIYVTVERFMRYLLGGGPYASEETKGLTVREKYDSLTKHQKANLKRALAEFIVQVTLILLTTFWLTKDDDDEWWSRQTRYYMLRLATEARAAAIFTDLGTVLVSPLAVISPLERWGKVAKNLMFHNDEILQSGPYAGHTKTYGAMMRAMPIYPQIVDFIEGDKDNKRTRMFEL